MALVKELLDAGYPHRARKLHIGFHRSPQAEHTTV
jgi:hypothetical protein